MMRRGLGIAIFASALFTLHSGCGTDERTFVDPSAGGAAGSATASGGKAGTSAVSSTTGTAGRGGGGATGAGGSIGAGGEAGTGGAAGTAATGGNAGAAGTGTAGTAGAGGMAGTGGTAGAAGAGGTGATCSPTTHACLDAVPGGWSGPVAFFDAAAGASLPSCPGDYPTSAKRVKGELNPGTPSCGCTCSSPMGTCGNLSLGSSSKACLTVPTPLYNLAPGVCTSVADNLAGRILDAAPGSFSGSCTAQPTKTIPTPQWGKDSLACGGATVAAGCTGTQICVPKVYPPFTAQCIYASGDVACPNGTYSKKYLRHDSFTESRDCTSCTCAPPMYCNGNVSFTQNGCTMQAILVASMAAPGCMSATPTGITHAAYYPSHQCTASMSMLTGSVTPQGTATFCCTP